MLYNDNTVERGLFYQALNVVLEALLDDDLELEGSREHGVLRARLNLKFSRYIRVRMSA